MLVYRFSSSSVSGSDRASSGKNYRAHQCNLMAPVAPDVAGHPDIHVFMLRRRGALLTHSRGAPILTPGNSDADHAASRPRTPESRPPTARCTGRRRSCVSGGTLEVFRAAPQPARMARSPAVRIVPMGWPALAPAGAGGRVAVTAGHPRRSKSHPLAPRRGGGGRGPTSDAAGMPPWPSSTRWGSAASPGGGCAMSPSTRAAGWP